MKTGSLFLTLVVTLALLVGLAAARDVPNVITVSSGDNNVCNLAGSYMNVDGNHIKIDFNGMFFTASSGETFYVTSDAVVHGSHGYTGIFEFSCDVINWSDNTKWCRDA
mmetsp:Transcript_19095/g.22817  ORF Transcript_19095/g.22817 Transcript_19095/m.22817 type:complete len:109 (+) Transcript_19095:73-399(+)|eukprot:CAMPEP_0197852892 /NCGR_PEP_ID=MMETSP1438-20131217/21659_1 /TAXON_ID=1461541 /ORGANISM="Pterosperma sp., Strain CCMP1384" /LENGTH=108 /DNA_ID=CAMNT_0043467113 /DNA_START=69 /DNA_END=395 /DNA_ORIENTATION=+